MMRKKCITAVLLVLYMLFPSSVFAGIFSTIEERGTIQPMQDGSGAYMLKSSGFYCMDENGGVSAKAEIHHFDHYEIDGTIFDGYYFHDADGMFVAASPRVTEMKNITAYKNELQIQENGEEVFVQVQESFDGIFLAGNLGKLGGAPKVCYLEEEKIGNTVFSGYYYVNENGKIVQESGTYFLQMTSNGRNFDGYYYFGGPNGALVTENCFTPEGYPVNADGSLLIPEDTSIKGLKKELKNMLSAYQGDWSIYIKNLNSGEQLQILDRPMGSASLIKLFVMAAVYDNMKQVLEQEAVLLKLPPEDPRVKEKVDKLLWNMITISDNEAFNELVKLQTPKYDFKHGARFINVYLEKNGYTESRVRHTLHPSGSKSDGIGEANVASAKECGILLEHIYHGSCVSEDASKEMLNLLLNQTVNWKLRAGLPANVQCANKSGENDSSQHDVGIVFGEQNDYIICVMSENYGDENIAFDEIRDISKMTYAYLNMWTDMEKEEK